MSALSSPAAEPGPDGPDFVGPARLGELLVPRRKDVAASPSIVDLGDVDVAGLRAKAARLTETQWSASHQARENVAMYREMHSTAWDVECIALCHERRGGAPGVPNAELWWLADKETVFHVARAPWWPEWWSSGGDKSDRGPNSSINGNVGRTGGARVDVSPAAAAAAAAATTTASPTGGGDNGSLLSGVFKQLGIDERRVLRVLLARLPAGHVITPHRDGFWCVRRCHRIHVPLVTTSDPAQMRFLVGRELPLPPRPDEHAGGVAATGSATGSGTGLQHPSGIYREGRAFELNNRRVHAVESAWDQPRIHLIIDVLDGDPLAVVHGGPRQCTTGNEFHDFLGTPLTLRDPGTWPSPSAGRAKEVAEAKRALANAKKAK